MSRTGSAPPNSLESEHPEVGSMRGSVERFPAVSVAETLALGGGIVDLWYWFYDRNDDAELLARHEALLTPDERERHMSFKFESDRRLFLATRALVRTALSGYAAVGPADWRFASGEHGKPRVDYPAVTPPIHFNLANTTGLVVCAVSLDYDAIGVDAERISRDADTVGLAERYFSASEAAALRALSPAEQRRRFFSYWTLKESYIKARGVGLALPLDQFSFLIDDDSISIGFEAQCADDATRWRFALLDAPPRHIVAVGADTGGAALSLRTTHVVPLAENVRQDERPTA
ncbi:MAG: 4'-phosphopantetheinyl transferase superfamily protein [Chloroflexi bacterium]|nr:4'-phosphopantetheinyl transferase superfamily protein [Chloroflexota bacterium]